MREIIHTTMALLTCPVLFGQAAIDTVSLKTSYANQAWYNLELGTETISPKSDWDLAFEATSFGSSIRINSVTGTKLWKYPNGTIAEWETLDTVGLSFWNPIYNSEISWSIGAFDKGIVRSNPFDLGWGLYSTITHFVTGDSLYVIKLADNRYKKLWIQNLASGSYNFVYADLDGENETEASVLKSQFKGKNFGYYSIINNLALDKEPKSEDWDLLFSQYTAFIPIPYTVAGVLANKHISMAKAAKIGAVSTYEEHENHTFSTNINTIGYDWKSFGGAGFVIEDSLIYFAKNNKNEVWKIIFTGFGGSSNGNFIFSKEKLDNITGVSNLESDKGISIYPNPSTGSELITILINIETSQEEKIQLFDMTGVLRKEFDITVGTGLNALELQNLNLETGSYIVKVGSSSQKLIVK